LKTFWRRFWVWCYIIEIKTCLTDEKRHSAKFKGNVLYNEQKCNLNSGADISEPWKTVGVPDIPYPCSAVHVLQSTENQRICSGRLRQLPLPLTWSLWKSTRWSGLTWRCLQTCTQRLSGTFQTRIENQRLNFQVFWKQRKSELINELMSKRSSAWALSLSGDKRCRFQVTNVVAFRWQTLSLSGDKRRFQVTNFAFRWQKYKW